jgi:hypothetical protein
MIKFNIFYFKLSFALSSFRFLRKMKSKFQDFTDLKSTVFKNILCGQRIKMIIKNPYLNNICEEKYRARNQEGNKPDTDG